MIKFSKEKVLLLHRLITEETGGDPNVRDIALLDSALESAFQTFDGNNRLLFTHLLASSQLWQRTIWVPSSMLSSGMHSLHLSQAKSHLGSN